VHGIDVERVRTNLPCATRPPRSSACAPTRPLVVTVANLRETKDYPNLPRRREQLTMRDPGDPVRHCRAKGPWPNEIALQHQTLGLGDRFTLLGYRADATGSSRRPTCSYASHHEGLPVSVMEALTLGVRWSRSRVGGVPEVVHDGENGLLVAPESAPALATHWNGPRRPTCGRGSGGARKHCRRFDIRVAVTRIEDL